MEYTLLGGGLAVLVCHGTSSDCFSTELAKPLVEGGFSVLTPSRPGYGRTPLKAGRSAAQAADSLAGLLDSLHIQTCADIAISGGGPTGLALAAGFPQRVGKLVLAAAVSRPDDRPNEPNYKSQMAFYGPMHSVTWGMLGLMSRLSPRSMARQTLAIFSTHDPDDGLSKLNTEDIERISRFYRRHSSRKGALTDAKHTVGRELLESTAGWTAAVRAAESKREDRLFDDPWAEALAGEQGAAWLSYRRRSCRGLSCAADTFQGQFDLADRGRGASWMVERCVKIVGSNTWNLRCKCIIRTKHDPRRA